MNTTQEHEKGTALLGYSPWRAILLVVASKHCSLLHIRSPWRANIALYATCSIINSGFKP